MCSPPRGSSSSWDNPEVEVGDMPQLTSVLCPGRASGGYGVAEAYTQVTLQPSLTSLWGSCPILPWAVIPGPLDLHRGQEAGIELLAWTTQRRFGPDSENMLKLPSWPHLFSE